MTGQQLVNWCVIYATAHPIKAVAIVVIGFVCARQIIAGLMILPGAVEDSKEKRRGSQSASRAVDPIPTDKAKKDGPWTR